MKITLQIKHFLWGLLFVTFIQQTTAQFLFNHYTTNEGLLSNEVTCSFRDSRGFLWIGTKDGLQIYNGEYFRSLRHHLLDSNSLSGDWVFSVAEDANGFIWVGTDKGICRIHPSHLRCKRFFPGRGMPANVKNEYCTVIAEDGGTVWALTSNYLMKFENNQFVCTDPMNYHGQLSWGDPNELLIAVGPDIYIKNTKNGSLKRIDSGIDEKMDYTAIYQDKKGNYWIGGWGDGIMRYNHEWKDPQVYKWDPDPVNPSTTNIIGSITGNEQFVYVGTSNGLYVYDLNKKIDLSVPTAHLDYEADKKNGISSPMVTNVFVDASDNLWVSTSNGLDAGLALNDEYKELITDAGFVTDYLWYENKLITSSWYGKGVVLYKEDFTMERNVQYFPEYNKELNNSQVSAICGDTDSSLWVATFNGLTHYDHSKNRTIEYYTKQSHGFATNRLNDVWVNHFANEVWAANYDAGITIYDLSTEKVKNINMSNSKFMTHDLVWGFYDSEDGYLWVLTNNGVMRYEYYFDIKRFRSFDDRWESWESINQNGVNIRMGRVLGLMKDSRGIIWVGTENGLFIYKDGKWFFKGIENGLPERNVNSIVEDKKGNIWIGFPTSIACLNTQNFSTFVLSNSSGILLPKVYGIFSNKITDELFLISENSIYGLEKERILENHTASPDVYLEEFLANGKSFYSITDSFQIEKTNFSYNENNIEIRFIAPHIGEIGKLLYSYRIGNGPWSEPNKNSSLTLPKLQPGTYNIEIRATIDGVNWSKKSLPVQFTIRPPFWATLWFRILMVVLILSGIVWWVRYLSTRKMRVKIIELEKEQAIERERSRLSRDMHDDLGSGLTKISILSEVVRKKMSANEKVDPYLENISDSSRELVQSLNNIIWSLNTGNATVQALLAYTREYASRFLDSCQVDFKFSSDNLQINSMVSEQVKRNIFLVVKEVLNNAVKHGAATEVEMHIEHNGEKRISITITDNGSGFDTSLIGKGNGLKNMKKRMEDIGGEFIITGEKGKGTQAKIRFRI